MYVRLNNDYVITTDRYQYILNKDTKRKDKNGNNILSSEGYYASLDHLIKTLLEREIRTKDVDNLKELRKDINEYVNDIVTTLDRNNKEESE